MSSSPALFQPVQVGAVELQHRVVMAPLTRMKATEKTHIPHAELVKEHYMQRSSTPGTLIISEATFVAQKAGTFASVPGIWSQKQIDAWKIIVDGIHEKKSFIFSQLWALGRGSDYEAARAEDPSLEYTAPSAIRLTGKEESPRALTVEEIKEFVQLWATAAVNAVHKAGFDGVEIHGSNGYLIDQFLQDVSNNRTDAYGGSVENRSRFALEVIDAVVSVVGAERTGLRLSPWNDFQDMRMEDPKPTFSYLVSEIKAKHPSLAYIHVVEPRVDGPTTREVIPEGYSNDFIRDIWSPMPLISTGAYTRDLALQIAQEKGDLIAFGRQFISNPDLVERLRKDIPLSEYDRTSFYLAGEVSRGYTDYPFAAGAN